MSPVFRTNGNTTCRQRRLAALAADELRRLAAGGRRPGRDSRSRCSLAELRALPSRTQITRHDCVEGWSAIGKWTGVPLSRRARTWPSSSREARYIVFHCADDFGGTPYYESIDLIDAFHPQTILAYDMNDDAAADRPRRAAAAPGRAPARLQAGQIRHADRGRRKLAGIGGGKGGFWEDVGDYDWYAGI